jgi:uncharacterized SAM-binding protein YcdF (DUF218 family)
MACEGTEIEIIYGGGDLSLDRHSMSLFSSTTHPSVTLRRPKWRIRNLENEDELPAVSGSCGVAEGRVAGWRRRIRRLAVRVLVLGSLGACAWLVREPLLRRAADLWIASDEVTHADAVVVLGGQIEIRPFAAAELYRSGLVSKVLVSNNEEGRAAAIGAVQGHTEANRHVLMKLGVPDKAIEVFGQANKSTRDEAVALREWVDRHGASTIIIPTEAFVTRRVRWTFEREFAGRNVRIEVPSYEAAEYTRAAWWKSPAGLIAFQNEIIKYIYYRLKY